MGGRAASAAFMGDQRRVSRRSGPRRPGLGRGAPTQKQECRKNLAGRVFNCCCSSEARQRLCVPVGAGCLRAEPLQSWSTSRQAGPLLRVSARTIASLRPPQKKEQPHSAAFLPPRPAGAAGKPSWDRQQEGRRLALQASRAVATSGPEELAGSAHVTPCASQTARSQSGAGHAPKRQVKGRLQVTGSGGCSPPAGRSSWKPRGAPSHSLIQQAYTGPVSRPEPRPPAAHSLLLPRSRPANLLFAAHVDSGTESPPPPPAAPPGRRVSPRPRARSRSREPPPERGRPW